MSNERPSKDIRILDPDAFENSMRRLRCKARRAIWLFAAVSDTTRMTDKWLKSLRTAVLVLGLTTPDIIRQCVTRPGRRGAAIPPDLIMDLVRGAQVQEGRFLISEQEEDEERKEYQRLRAQVLRRLRKEGGSAWKTLGNTEKAYRVQQAIERMESKDP